MKMLAAAILLLVSSALAQAHDVRHSDGRELSHDHATELRRLDEPRNVSATAQVSGSCEEANWPDIPVECLERAPAVVAIDAEQPRRVRPIAPVPQPSQVRVRITLSPSIVLLGWGE
jgi:hypothetical protein